MKDLVKGQLVCSKAGRDKTQYFAVVDFAPGRVLVADGQRYTLDDPKPKNPAHLAPARTVLPAAALSNDQQLAAAVEAFCQTAGAGTEEDRKLV